MEERALQIGLTILCILIFGILVMRLQGIKFKLPQTKKAQDNMERAEGSILRIWVSFVIFVSINALFFYIIPEENWWTVSSWIARAATGAAFASWMKYSYFSSMSQWNRAYSFRFLARAATVMSLIFIGISMFGGKEKRSETQGNNQAAQQERSDYRSGLGFKLIEVAVPYSAEGGDDWSWGLKIFWPNSYDWRVVDELDFERSLNDVRIHVQKGNGEKTLFFQGKTNVSMKVELYSGNRNAAWEIVKRPPEIAFQKKKPAQTEVSKKTQPKAKVEKKGRSRGTTGGVRYVQPGQKTDPEEEEKQRKRREYVKNILKSKNMGGGVQPGLKEGSSYESSDEKTIQEEKKTSGETMKEKKRISGGVHIIPKDPAPPPGMQRVGEISAPALNEGKLSKPIILNSDNRAKYELQFVDNQGNPSKVFAEVVLPSGEAITNYYFSEINPPPGTKIRFRSSGNTRVRVIVFGNEYAKFDVTD